jgi:transposase InsO family protein
MLAPLAGIGFGILPIRWNCRLHRQTEEWYTLISTGGCNVKDIEGRFGVPGIINTDQGSQFTAEEFTKAVLDSGGKLSMDGRGAWRDNVLIERLWRSVKYECVYLKAYDGVSAARTDIGRYIEWFNTTGRIRVSMAFRFRRYPENIGCARQQLPLPVGI